MITTAEYLRQAVDTCIRESVDELTDEALSVGIITQYTASRLRNIAERKWPQRIEVDQ